MKNFKDLIVWQRAIDLVTLAYKLTKTFPTDEKFGLTSQMRRSAVSIPSNIAEGHMRSSQKDFRKFLKIALGSSAEFETQTIIAGNLGYLTENDQQELLTKTQEVSKMTASLAAKLRSS